jgi:hypothetical protein
MRMHDVTSATLQSWEYDEEEETLRKVLCEASENVIT